MKINLVGAFIRNKPFGTEIAFLKGLQELGGHQINTVDTSYEDQVWLHDADVTLVFKWMEGYWDDLKRCGGKKIVYQPDDLRFPHIQEMMRKMRDHCDYALMFDDDGAQMARDMGYRKADRLLLTADPEVYFPPTKKVRKDIDFVFVGSFTAGPNHASRRKMVEVLNRNGFRAYSGETYSMDGMRDTLWRSRVVLNHATDVGQPFGSGYGYQCRHFEAGMTGACLLSNKVLNESCLHGFVEFDSEESLLEQARLLLDDEQLRVEKGQELLADIKAHHMPVHRAQDLVRFIEGLE